MKGEEYPNENSKIDLSDRSEAVIPKIVYKHKISQRTSESVRAGLVVIKQVISEENLGQFKVYRHLLGKRHGFYLNPNWHPMGTMRMANNKLEGICDSNLQVFDNPGLFLLSAAVFPTGSNHNPTCMVMALGQRLADHLLNPID
jgi:choline dehydrogenase-like flavoprotein